MALVDTSVWVDVLRGATGAAGALTRALENDETLLTRFTEMELLQGCKSDREWTLLAAYLEGQAYLEGSLMAWRAAARIYYDLRRLGKAVRSPIDCLIAQIAIEHDVLLLHRDRNFTTIASVSSLREMRLDW